MKVIIASDSFKGSLTSSEAGEAISRGLKYADKTINTHVINIGDGGDGTLSSLTSGRSSYDMINVRTVNAVGDPIISRYGISTSGDTAIIELASACGIAQLKKPCPMTASTLGTGIMVADAIRRGTKTIYVALGGSASTDGGMGLLTALGYHFYDSKGNLLKPMGLSMLQVARINGSNVTPNLSDVKFIGACDVTNASLGHQGAAIVFGPQKGATPQQVAMLEKGMKNYLNVLENFFGHQIQDIPRTGAAGATGAALKALGAKLISGAELCIETTGIERLLANADLLVTAEGQADAQSLMGKITGILLQKAHLHNVPTWIIAARVKDRQQLLEAGFKRVIEVVPPTINKKFSMIPSVAKHYLTKACQKEITQFEHIVTA